MAPVGQVVKPRISYTDLANQPEDGRRYEIYDGEVFVVPSPLPIHQRAVHALLQLLDAYASHHGGEAFISPIDIVFSEHDVVQPDLAFFSASRRHLVSADTPIRSAPDLVVEVLSPSTEASDRGKKLQTFARFGVPEYWIVDSHASSIEVLRLRDGNYELHSRAAAGESAVSATLPELTILLPTQERSW